MDIIANEENIFSDIILEDGFPWNTHKPDVHKNYLLSISRLLLKINNLENQNLKIEFLLERITEAKSLYRKLEEKFKVYLNDESSDYHLGTWDAILRKYQA